MEQVDQQIHDNEFSASLSQGLPAAAADSHVPIHDIRVARLLVVLTELDVRLAGLESLPKEELSELVSSATLACGFANVIEAHNVIAAILETIDPQIYS